MNIYFFMIDHLVYIVYFSQSKKNLKFSKFHACTLEFAKEQFTLLLALAIYTHVYKHTCFLVLTVATG